MTVIDNLQDESSSDFVNLHLLDVATSSRLTASECGEVISAAGLEVASVLAGGGKLLICGNGGSAAHSSHIAGELVSSFRRGLRRPALPAISLAENIAAFTAFTNDFNLVEVFARQVEAFGETGDVLMAISTSGESANVIAAARTARNRDLAVLTLTGAGPNTLSSIADIAIEVPSKDTATIQAVHIAIAHIICEYVDRSYDT